jgi:hypothetical protein
VTSATNSLLDPRRADISLVELVAFGRALGELTVDDIRSIALDLNDAIVSTADEIAATRAVLVIEQTLRRTHRLQRAAQAALVAATTVQDVAKRARVALPDQDVTRVARAAAQIARGLVVADVAPVDDALRCLGKGWKRMPGCADLVAA